MHTVKIQPKNRAKKMEKNSKLPKKAAFFGKQLTHTTSQTISEVS